MQRIASGDFAAASTAPLLDDASVHVWRLAIETPHDHRAVAAAAHALLGRLLARYGGLEEPPVIARTVHGKPYAPSLPHIDFNLSHARNHVLIAIAREQALGVDIEQVDRKTRVDALARRFFARSEADALAALPEALRVDAFVRLWTLKEAVLKALGEGLAFGLDRIAFALDGSGGPIGIAASADAAGPPEAWQLALLDPAPGFRGALAWQGGPRTVRAFVATHA
jgi:4'-phosphopantetheinyl transferase